MKTTYWILIIAAAIVLIYGYNQGWFTKAIPEEVLNANGTPVNPTAKVKACDPACLVAYPEGSKYYGHYYCNKNCSSATFQRPIYEPIYVIKPVVGNPVRPIPPGPPRPVPAN